MKRLTRIASCVLFGSLLLQSTASAAGGFKRLAVMDFENASGDKKLDWIGLGIAETLSTELSLIQDFTLVERKRLNDALKEIKFGRSEAVDQATAQKMGKMLGADSVVVGSFQKSQDTLRILARVVDVETGTIRVPARVDGKDILELQIELAKKLVEGMKGSLAEADKRRLEVAPTKNVDAQRAYADGVYYYRNDLAQDALTEFDRALALDSNYVEAHFYKGMALAKLKRWDDAITAFKRTLPRTQEEHRVKWSWDATFEAEGSVRSVFPALDLMAFSAQNVFSRVGTVRAQKRLVYAERHGKNTIFQFVNPEKRSATRLELPDDSVLNAALATDRMTIVASATLATLFAGTLSLHGVDAADGSLLWNNDLKDLGGFPLLGAADNVVLEYLPPLRRLVALNDTTLQPKWQRNDLDLEWQLPLARPSRSNGTLVFASSAAEKKIHAIRVSDGQDAWTADLQTDKSCRIASDQALIVFEPDRRVFALDIETGKQLFDVPVRQVVEAHASAFAVVTVTALTYENTLFFPSDADELLAVDLERATPSDRRVRWKTPLQKKVLTISAHGSRVYVGTKGGELVILDARTGDVLASRRIADKSLGVDYAGDDVVVASSEDAVFGLDPNTGVKQWDYPSNPRAQKPLYFKGVVILQTSGTQMSALDAQTGTRLWQYAGKLIPASLFAQIFGADMPSVYLTEDSFFIVEEGGVKEYAVERGVSQGITNKEALTELAGALLAKGDLPEASRFAATAWDADPNFPPLRLLQARLDQARGDAMAARRELVMYVDLAGRQSRSGQDIIAELKRDHALLWHTEAGKAALYGPIVIDEGKKLLSVARLTAKDGRDAQFALLDAAGGKVLWRQNAERVLDEVYEPKSRRVFFVRGQTSDPRAVQLNAVDIDTGNRKELARLTAPFPVTAVSIVYADDRIFVATASADTQVRKAAVRIMGFNATTGRRLWETPHDFTSVNFPDVLIPVGVFYVMKDYLLYAIGRDLWVVRAADGTIHAQHREDTFIVSNTNVASADDVTYFGTVANELVAYNVATKEVVLRTSIPDYLSRDVLCACGIVDRMLFTSDHQSVFAYDMSPAAATADRMKWRLNAGAGLVFRWGGWKHAGYVWALRDDNVLLRLDLSTGSVVNEYPLLWAPVDLGLDGDRLYAFTADGQAYAMQLKAMAK